jgi:hypothetical protein
MLYESCYTLQQTFIYNTSLNSKAKIEYKFQDVTVPNINTIVNKCKQIGSLVDKK